MFSTFTVVPSSLAVLLTDDFPFSLKSISFPTCSSMYFDKRVTLETDVMVERASPLNPILINVFRSLISVILDVVCESNTDDIFSFGIPIPLSDTSIKSIPPFFTLIVIFVD